MKRPLGGGGGGGMKKALLRSVVYPFGFCERLAAETPAVERKIYVFMSHTGCVQKGIDKKVFSPNFNLDLFITLIHSFNIFGSSKSVSFV